MISSHKFVVYDDFSDGHDDVVVMGVDYIGSNLWKLYARVRMFFGTSHGVSNSWSSTSWSMIAKRNSSV